MGRAHDAGGGNAGPATVPPVGRAAGRATAASWLWLATAAVAASGLFAILIALARVPALGTLFPGPEFYRVALTLHVNLSQAVWFMAFAGVLWSLERVRAQRGVESALLAAAALGALGVACAVGIGRPAPIMSNYLPVLDSTLFLAALALFAAAVTVKAALFACTLPQFAPADTAQARHAGLWLAAGGFLGCVVLLVDAHVSLPDGAAGYDYFERLFWGAGHAWQSVLVLLMMVCWMELAPSRAGSVSSRLVGALLVAAALPVALGLGLAALNAPGSAAYRLGFTQLMQWTIWPAPLAMGVLLAVGRHRRYPGLGLSLLLFVCGLAIGALIDGETTLVTAHYHGTIGAVTLAFMACALALLPRLGLGAVPVRAARLQLGLYGHGLLLMMLGLAGAGWMGAPRKTPGELGIAWSVETVSRIVLGTGGVLATAGILMFAVLVLVRLWPRTARARRIDRNTTRRLGGA